MTRRSWHGHGHCDWHGHGAAGPGRTGLTVSRGPPPRSVTAARMASGLDHVRVSRPHNATGLVCRPGGPGPRRRPQAAAAHWPQTPSCAATRMAAAAVGARPSGPPAPPGPGPPSLRLRPRAPAAAAARALTAAAAQSPGALPGRPGPGAPAATESNLNLKYSIA